jgi:hypothetical protein
MTLHYKKKVIDFPVSCRDMSVTKLSLAGNNLIIPGQREFVSDFPAGDWKNIFYSVPVQ